MSAYRPLADFRNTELLGKAFDVGLPQGRYAEAEPLYKRSLAIWEEALGPEHPNVATSLNNLAGLYRAQGRYDEAEPLHKRAMTIDEMALGPGSLGVNQARDVREPG